MLTQKQLVEMAKDRPVTTMMKIGISVAVKTNILDLNNPKHSALRELAGAIDQVDYNSDYIENSNLVLQMAGDKPDVYALSDDMIKFNYEIVQRQDWMKFNFPIEDYGLELEQCTFLMKLNKHPTRFVQIPEAANQVMEAPASWGGGTQTVDNTAWMVLDQDGSIYTVASVLRDGKMLPNNYEISPIFNIPNANVHSQL